MFVLVAYLDPKTQFPGPDGAVVRVFGPFRDRTKAEEVFRRLWAAREELQLYQLTLLPLEKAKVA